MPNFTRRLSETVLQNLRKNLEDHAWLADLFRRWRPAGQPLDGVPGERGLRLAIRDNYLSFYRYGQSVAKVEFDASGTPRAEIHAKYVLGPEAGDRNVKLRGGYYAAAGDGDGFEYRPGDFEAWIERAQDYRGIEKRLIEQVVAMSPGVIDLEMALPANAGESSAARIDLVAVEIDDSIPSAPQFRIVMWEVKRSDDSRARARSEPKLIDQIARYRRWLEHGSNRTDVLRAYLETCRLLVLLADTVRPSVTSPFGFAVTGVANSWSPLLGAERPADSWMTVMLEAEPRLLIVDDPDHPSASFVANGHLRHLASEPHNFLIQIVDQDESGELMGWKRLFDKRKTYCVGPAKRT